MKSFLRSLFRRRLRVVPIRFGLGQVVIGESAWRGVPCLALQSAIRHGSVGDTIDIHHHGQFVSGVVVALVIENQIGRDNLIKRLIELNLPGEPS